jgi:hypothetical protein
LSTLRNAFSWLAQWQTVNNGTIFDNILVTDDIGKSHCFSSY